MQTPIFSDSVICHSNYVWFVKDQRLGFPAVESRMCLWCRQGRGQVTVNGMVHPIHEGDYLFLPWRHRIDYRPDRHDPFLLGGIHIVPHHSREHALEFDVAHFPTHPLHNCAWRSDRDLGVLSGVMILRSVQGTPLWALSDYIVRLFIGERRDESHMRALAPLLLDELTATVKAMPTQGQQRSVADFRRVCEHIRKNLAEPLTASDLAAFLNCSESTVNRMIRAHAGMSSIRWVRQARIERAKLLLVSTSLPIGEIARQIGVPDPFHFSKLFKQWTGESPRVYRRRTPLL